MKPQHSDAAVVFFAGFDKSKKLDNECITRLEKVVKYYKCGMFDHVVCAGGNRPAMQKYGSKVMKNYLISRNIPGDSIFCDTLSFNTGSNLNEACKILKQQKWNKVMFISSNLHLFRISFREKECDGIKFYYPNLRDRVKISGNMFYTWKSIHHEWIAMILRAVLPQKTYHRMIKRVRGV